MDREEYYKINTPLSEEGEYFTITLPNREQINFVGSREECTKYLNVMWRFYAGGSDE